MGGFRCLPGRQAVDVVDNGYPLTGCFWQMSFFVGQLYNSHLCICLPDVVIAPFRSLLKKTKNKVWQLMPREKCGNAPPRPFKHWGKQFGNIKYLINEHQAYHIFVQLTSIILTAANYALLLFGIWYQILSSIWVIWFLQNGLFPTPKLIEFFLLHFENNDQINLKKVSR